MRSLFESLAWQALGLPPEITPVPNRGKATNAAADDFNLLSSASDRSWHELNGHTEPTLPESLTAKEDTWHVTTPPSAPQNDSTRPSSTPPEQDSQQDEAAKDPQAPAEAHVSLIPTKNVNANSFYVSSLPASQKEDARAVSHLPAISGETPSTASNPFSAKSENAHAELNYIPVPSDASKPAKHLSAIPGSTPLSAPDVAAMRSENLIAPSDPDRYALQFEGSHTASTFPLNSSGTHPSASDSAITQAHPSAVQPGHLIAESKSMDAIAISATSESTNQGHSPDPCNDSLSTVQASTYSTPETSDTPSAASPQPQSHQVAAPHTSAQGTLAPDAPDSPQASIASSPATPSLTPHVNPNHPSAPAYPSTHPAESQLPPTIDTNAEPTFAVFSAAAPTAPSIQKTAERLPFLPKIDAPNAPDSAESSFAHPSSTFAGAPQTQDPFAYNSTPTEMTSALAALFPDPHPVTTQPTVDPQPQTNATTPALTKQFFNSGADDQTAQPASASSQLAPNSNPAFPASLLTPHHSAANPAPSRIPAALETTTSWHSSIIGTQSESPAPVVPATSRQDHPAPAAQQHALAPSSSMQKSTAAPDGTSPQSNASGAHPQLSTAYLPADPGKSPAHSIMPSPHAMGPAQPLPQDMQTLHPAQFRIAEPSQHSFANSYPKVEVIASQAIYAPATHAVQQNAIVPETSEASAAELAPSFEPAALTHAQLQPKHHPSTDSHAEIESNQPLVTPQALPTRAPYPASNALSSVPSATSFASHSLPLHESVLSASQWPHAANDVPQQNPHTTVELTKTITRFAPSQGLTPGTLLAQPQAASPSAQTTQTIVATPDSVLSEPQPAIGKPNATAHKAPSEPSYNSDSPTPTPASKPATAVIPSAQHAQASAPAPTAQMRPLASRILIENNLPDTSSHAVHAVDTATPPTRISQTHGAEPIAPSDGVIRELASIQAPLSSSTSRNLPSPIPAIEPPATAQAAPPQVSNPQITQRLPVGSTPSATAAISGPAQDALTSSSPIQREVAPHTSHVLGPQADPITQAPSPFARTSVPHPHSPPQTASASSANTAHPPQTIARATLEARLPSMPSWASTADERVTSQVESSSSSIANTSLIQSTTLPDAPSNNASTDKTAHPFEHTGETRSSTSALPSAFLQFSSHEPSLAAHPAVPPVSLTSQDSSILPSPALPAQTPVTGSPLASRQLESGSSALPLKRHIAELQTAYPKPPTVQKARENAMPPSNSHLQQSPPSPSPLSQPTQAHFLSRASLRQSAFQAEPPPLRVDIGRIEMDFGENPLSSSTHSRRARAMPKFTLDQYLKQRARRR